MPHALRRVALISFLLALLAPGTALAALNVTRTGGALTVTGSTSADTHIEVGADDKVFVSGSEVAVGTTTPLTCVDKDTYVECGEATVTSFTLALTGEGNDYIEVSGLDAFTTSAAVTLSTGPGDDQLSVNGPQDVTADLGAGDDSADTGEGDDVVHGGPGNDSFSLAAGTDRGFGDDGSDHFSAGGSADGSDSFDGGPDTQTVAKPGSGDTVDYGRRITAIQITLPADAKTVPEGNNGATAENDHLARVENAIGSDPDNFGKGPTTVTGNERANYLKTGWGDDTLAGGKGDDLLEGTVGGDTYDSGDGEDRIEARDRFPYVDPQGVASIYEDIDTVLNCSGGSNDAVRRDPDDPSAINCEHQAPYMLEVPRIFGSAQVSSKLTVARGKTFGEANDLHLTWYSCPDQIVTGEVIGSEKLDCTIISKDESYTPTGDDLGRRLFARVELRWAYGEGASAFTPQIGPIKPASPAGSGGPGPGGTGPGGTGNGPGGAKTFLQMAAEQAQRQLGLGSFTSNVTLGPGTGLFEAPVTKGGVVVLKGTLAPAITGIACEKACTATVASSVILVPKPKGKKKGKNKTIKLAAQTVKVAAGALGVVKLNPTSKQRKLIKKARKAKLTLAYSLKYADGTIRKAKKSYLIKIK